MKAPKFPCEECGGEGRHLSGGHLDHKGGKDYTDAEECKACEGDGEARVACAECGEMDRRCDMVNDGVNGEVCPACVDRAEQKELRRLARAEVAECQREDLGGDR